MNIKISLEMIPTLHFLNWLLPMLMNGQVSVGGYEVEDSELGMVAEGREEYKKM